MKKLVIGISAEGSVNLLRGQLKHFKGLGYHTYLISPYSTRSSDFCKTEGCEHLVVPIKREISVGSDLVNLLRIIKLFIKIKPDIINLGTPKISLLGMLAGKILTVKKRIYTCRGFRYEHEKGLKRSVLILMEKITASCAHQIICISPSVRELGVKDKIFSEKKSIVINKGSSNGVDLTLFNRALIPQQDISILRHDLKLNGKFVFGFVGRIVDRKGIRELVDAFDILYKQNIDLRLLLVGPFEEAQLTDKELIKDVNTHPGIIWVGRKLQHEVPPYVALMDVFVLPAWWEGFGNVLVQAAAMGIPVISTKATGTMDAVSPNYNGLLIPVKSVEALTQAMHELYSNEQLRSNFGSHGIEWAKNFDRYIIWQEMDRLYQKA